MATSPPLTFNREHTQSSCLGEESNLHRGRSRYYGVQYVFNGQTLGAVPNWNL
jgi:hypothetical protein